MSIAACRRHALTIMACLLLAAPAMALQADKTPKTPKEMLEDFIHYTIIAKPSLAESWGQQLLSTIHDDTELAAMLDDDSALNDRFERALGLAHRVPELESIAAELDRRAMDGRLAMARDLQRIDAAITMLTGHQRARLHGHKMLMAAGEYAVPRLLQVLVQGQDEALRTASDQMLVDIGRLSVAPLCAALPDLDDGSQRAVCRILGEIRLPQSAPYLLAVAADDQASAATRDAAQRAFRFVGGMEGDLAGQFQRLGQQYFSEAESLIAYPYEPTNNVWSYDVHFGLEAVPVPTEIYSEVMAMKMASEAIHIEPRRRDAVGLFVAANLRRANELPDGAGDPIYGSNPYSPEFYATVFGTQICMDVLAAAIDRYDTQLVRDAIAALSDTTGGANLFSSDTGRQPLLEALRYPDRRVQYEAALTLGRALPDQRFSGDVNVVPLLGSAVRSGGSSFAVVLAPDGEDRRGLVARLEKLGFTIVATGNSFNAARDEIALATGVDLIVVQALSAEEAMQDVGETRVYPKTAATPVMVIASEDTLTKLKQQYRDDVRVMVARGRVDDDTFGTMVDALMLRAAGGRMTEAEAEAYAVDAIYTLRDIAISGDTAYAIADAEASLLEALNTRQGGLRQSVASIVALIDSARSQQALFDAALAATGDEQIQLLDAVAESVRRYGNRAEQRHIEALLDLVEHSGGATAEAAARVHGALDLGAADAIKLIP